MKKSELTPKQVSSVTCPTCGVAIRKSVNEDRTGFYDTTKTALQTDRSSVFAPRRCWRPTRNIRTGNRTRNDFGVNSMDKIGNILASVNVQNGGKGTNGNGTSTLAEFIERNYFPRLDWRLQQPAGNELHIEPSTIKGYKDIWKVHVQESLAASMRLRDFTARGGQFFLESLPQNLSHQTHLRIKNFMRGVFTWGIVSGALDGSNPMEATKAGGQTRRDDSMEGLTETQKLRKKKIQASNEHAYTLEEVAEMLDKLPEPARTVVAVAAFRVSPRAS